MTGQGFWRKISEMRQNSLQGKSQRNKYCLLIEFYFNIEQKELYSFYKPN